MATVLGFITSVQVWRYEAISDYGSGNGTLLDFTSLATHTCTCQQAHWSRGFQISVSTFFAGPISADKHFKDNKIIIK